MTHDCITDQQGRLPCTCKLHTANSYDSSPNGDPWEFVDAIVIPLRWVALAASLAFTVLALAGFLSHN